jgi:hypothetical protein
MKAPCVYLAASRYRGTLYIGVTSNLPQRISEHRLGLFDGSTKRYGVKMLEAVFGELDMGEKPWPGAAARDRMRWRWRLGDLLTRAAGTLMPLVEVGERLIIKRNQV